MTLTFARPALLLLLLTLPPAVAWFILHARRQQRQVATLQSLRWQQQIERAQNDRSRRLALQLIALALAIIALAGPRWGEETRPVETDGLQLMILLDLSQSMLAGDAPDTRLAQAKQIAIVAADALTDADEVGLTVFAAEPRLLLPLTAAHAQLAPPLAQAHPADLTQGTALAPAVATAVRAMPTPRSGQPLLLIISDGEDHSGAAVQAVRSAAAEGVIVLTVGVGTPDGAPVPVLDAQRRITGSKQDAAGQPIISRLRPDTLQQMAELGNGRYLPGSDAAETLPALLGELWAAHTGRQIVVTPVERYPLFLLVAVLLLAAAHTPVRQPNERRRRVAAGGTIILMFWLTGCGANAVNEWVEQGNDAFAAARYEQARLAYETAVGLRPESAIAHYNLANTHYRLQAYAQSIDIMQRPADEQAADLQTNALFNQGNAYFRLGQYEQAIAAYKAVLRRRPDDGDAKHNLELALQQLASAAADDGGSGGEEKVERPSLPAPDGNLNFNPEAGTVAEAPVERRSDGVPLPISPEAAQQLLSDALQNADTLPGGSTEAAAEDGSSELPIRDW